MLLSPKMPVKLKLVWVISQPDGLQLQEVGDFEALNCLPPQNLIRSTKLHLTTEPAFLPNACYGQVFFYCLHFILSGCLSLITPCLKITFALQN